MRARAALSHEVGSEELAALILGSRATHIRHTFASHVAMRGVPLRQIQEWLGHGSIVVTQRYAHLAQGIGDDLIRRLAPPHTNNRRCRPTAHGRIMNFGPVKIGPPGPSYGPILNNQ